MPYSISKFQIPSGKNRGKVYATVVNETTKTPVFVTEPITYETFVMFQRLVRRDEDVEKFIEKQRQKSLAPKRRF